MIRMTDESFFRVRNPANTVKDFFKSALAPYGNTMSFVEILPGRIINTANIVEIREIEDNIDFEDTEVINEVPEVEDEIESEDPNEITE